MPRPYAPLSSRGDNYSRLPLGMTTSGKGALRRRRRRGRLFSSQFAGEAQRCRNFSSSLRSSFEMTKAGRGGKRARHPIGESESRRLHQDKYHWSESCCVVFSWTRHGGMRYAGRCDGEDSSLVSFANWMLHDYPLGMTTSGKALCDAAGGAGAYFPASARVKLQRCRNFSSSLCSSFEMTRIVFEGAGGAPLLRRIWLADGL